MLFSSGIFLFIFFPCFIALYWLLPKRWKNLWVLLASVLFYAWGAPKFIFVLLASVTIDFIAAQRLDGPNGKWWLRLGLVANIGLLAYFKYANFFVENTNAVLTSLGITPMHWIEVALPIGISFFTFQKISYLLDVRNHVKDPARRWTDYAMYVVLFPQLIAGPIVRYRDIADALESREENWNKRFIGLFRFTIGLSKKVLIANAFGAYADHVMLHPDAMGWQAFLGLLAYTFQIFYDFSGYSDMALGIGMMMGFKFPENFDIPYRSGSITEFWRRWHITLGVWMRDYLYVPLGGNRKGINRTYFNLVLVFFISGLWHGDQWTFIIWGLFHGFWIMVERMFLGKVLKRAPRAISVLWTFALVMVGWAFFRLDTAQQAWDYLGRIMQPSVFTVHPDFNTAYLIYTFAVGILFAFGFTSSKWPGIYRKSHTRIQIIGMLAATIILLIASSATLMQSEYNPFIYFRF